MKDRKVFSRLENQFKRGYNKIFTDYNLTRKDWEETKKFFNNRCAYCGKKTINLAREHIVSATNGGDYVKGNIIPSCNSCNNKKKNKDVKKWFKETFPKRYAKGITKIDQFVKLSKYKYKLDRDRMNSTQWKEYTKIKTDWDKLLKRMKLLREKIMKK